MQAPLWKMVNLYSPHAAGLQAWGLGMAVAGECAWGQPGLLTAHTPGLWRAAQGCARCLRYSGCNLCEPSQQMERA